MRWNRTLAYLLRVDPWLRSPYKTSYVRRWIRLVGLQSIFYDDLDYTILAHESKRERAPNTGVLLDSRQVRTISMYVTLDIYVV
jgi:hypothetical protein